MAEGEISELHVGLKGTMNALFLKDLAQKTRRGLEAGCAGGSPAGGTATATTSCARLRDDGTLTAGERAINAGEAAVVRRIFARLRRRA